MRRRKKKRKFEEAKPTLEMTPMIDVVFNLLIFFLCQPFKIAEGDLDAFLPKNVGMFETKVDKDDLMTVVVKLKHSRGQAPRIYVGSTRIAADRHGEPNYDVLYEKIAGLAHMGEKAPPVEIQSDRLVKYRYVVGALNSCTKARIEDIRFTLPLGRPGGKEER